MSKQQLEILGFEYLKSKRVGNYLVTIAKFDLVFLSELKELSSMFDTISYPNIVFKGIAVLILNVEKNSYHTHRLYCFPDNYKLYTYNVTSQFERMIKTLDKGDPNIFVNKFILKFPSSRFGLRRYTESYFKPSPRSLSYISRSLSYMIEFEYDIDINFNIDKYVEYVGRNIYGFHLTDNFFSDPIVSKTELVKSLKCVCNSNYKEIKFMCKKCDYPRKPLACNNIHPKKCSCGKFDHFHPNCCMKCYVRYSTSAYTMNNFDKENGGFISWYQIGGYLQHMPTHLYNGSGGGLCLGNGREVINSMINEQVNPIELMIAFKMNLAYTDSESTDIFYNGYKQRIDIKEINEYSEYNSQLMLINLPHKRDHIFSLRCYCQQCFFYRIILFHESRVLNKKGFFSNQNPVVSRDTFIQTYKRFLNRRPKMRDGYLHETIKAVVNTPFEDWIN